MNEQENNVVEPEKYDKTGNEAFSPEFTGSVAGVAPLPDFMGVVCKTCGRPFLIWKTKYGQDAADMAEVRRYVKQGHVEAVIDSSIVGDITKWCQGH